MASWHNLTSQLVFSQNTSKGMINYESTISFTNITEDTLSDNTTIHEGNPKERYVFFSLPFIYMFLLIHMLRILRIMADTFQRLKHTTNNDVLNILISIFILVAFYITVMAMKFVEISQMFSVYFQVLRNIAGAYIVHMCFISVISLIKRCTDKGRQKLSNCGGELSLPVFVVFLIHCIMLGYTEEGELAFINILCCALQTFILIFLNMQLKYASRFGYAKLLKILLWIGFHVEGSPLLLAMEKSILLYPVEYRHTGCVETLLKYGADPNKMSQTGNVFTDSITSDSVAVVASDERACKLNNGELWSNLCMAVWQDHSECANLLLKYGATTETIIGKGVSALYIASRKNYMVCARTLLSYGANIRGVSWSGHTAMHAAAFAGNLDIMRYLVMFEKKQLKNYSVHITGTENSIIDKKTSKQQTPLHIAAFYGKEDIMEYLLHENAQILQDCWGASALHIYLSLKVGKCSEKILHLFVTQKRFANGTKELLQDGNIMGSKDINEPTPGGAIVSCNHINEPTPGGDIVSCSYINEPTPGGAIVSCSYINQPTPGGAIVSCSHTNELTPGGAIVSYNHINEPTPGGDIVSCSNINVPTPGGAVVNCRDINGWTPLFLAIRHGDVNACRLLLKYGANLNCCDIHGLSPEDHAIRSIRRRHIDEHGSHFLQNIYTERQPDTMEQLIRGYDTCPMQHEILGCTAKNRTQVPESTDKECSKRLVACVMQDKSIDNSVTENGNATPYWDTSKSAVTELIEMINEEVEKPSKER